MEAESPYMLLVAPVLDFKQENVHKEYSSLLDRLYSNKSALPAITHVDGSARVQTVTEEQNPRYYRLLKEFEKVSGVPVLINTSFNVRGEPIVCTPEDAYRCFMHTGLDFLVVGNFLMRKTDQPEMEINSGYVSQWGLD